jgi:hypothetical protein
MYATIRLSPYIQVQGIILRTLPNGAVAVDCGGREIVGEPAKTGRPSSSEEPRPPA